LNLRDSIRHNLRGLLDFRGRDPLGAFWPYALTAIALLVAVPMLAIQMFLVPTVMAEPSSSSPTSFLPFYLVWLLLVAASLGAAVTRRLRDANQSPLWGLWPLLAAALNGLFIQLAFTAEDIPNLWFFADFGAILLCFAMLIVLVVKLNRLTSPKAAEPL
jgi:uncharacterized membrane protein YhaH (DUF805 family)